jgi:predicted SprT family Zn-dependent metalloprotease
VLSHVALEAEREKAFEAVARALGAVPWPHVPVRWNRRLRRAGRAVVTGRRGRIVAATIELSPPYFEVYPDDLPGILVHEAVHVALAALGRPFGHGPLFRAACRRAEGLMHSRHMPGRVFRYRCPVCESVLDRRRRPSGDRWCARCVVDAEDACLPSYTPERALVLVGVHFQGPEPPAAREAPACDGAVYLDGLAPLAHGT